MKQYGWLKAMYMSFYSRQLYRDVAQNWGLGTFFYLFLLLAICWAVLMFRIQPVINLASAQAISEIVPQLPETIIIKEGKVTTPENKPYIIRSNDSKEVIGIIDTSGQYTDLEKLKTPLLITQDKVIYSENHDAVKTYKIHSSLNANFVPTQVKDVILKVIGWLWIILFPISLIGSFFYRVLQSILYAILGKLYAVIANISVSYVEIVKLTMVANTPTIIISTVLAWRGMWFHYSVLFFVLSIAYVIFAIGANNNKI